LLALLAYDVGDHQAAVPAFRACLDTVPRDREARLYLCLSLLALQHWDGARTEAEHLVAWWPDDDAGHGLLALARLGAGDEPAARLALEDYDRLASMREAAGLPRRLPDQPALAALREAP
jgi:tetratricopeptide (TPR) repeat protein